jgi:cytochrome c-type biogenesis protein CcmH
MSSSFYPIAVVMTLVAIGFVAAPMLPARQHASEGYVRTGLLVAIAVILVSTTLYASLGRPEMAGAGLASAAARPDTRASAATSKAPAIASLIPGLEERLTSDPDDGASWLLLAKSYRHLGREAEAADAYARAAALGQSDASFDAGAVSNARPVAGIRGRITVDEQAEAMLSDDDTVFVIARAVNGSPMPLAVLRRQAGELPFDFELTDTSSMISGNPLSRATEVIVSVKVSSSGDALSTIDALSVTTGPVPTVGGESLTLQLSGSKN